MPESPSPGPPGFRVEPAPEVEADLVGRAELPAGPAPVWVTDLVDLRPAFWSKIERPPLSPERGDSTRQGRHLHAAVLARLSPTGLRELRVRRHGIVGAIDLVEEVPIELKTTSRLVPGDRLAEERPSYLEQLAMYCGLLGKPSGRLLVLGLTEGAPTGAVSVDVPRIDVDRVLEAMDRRAEAIREAWSRANPERLPRCRWFDRGCEYRAAGICDCTGAESPAGSELLAATSDPEERPDEAERLLRAALEVTSEGLESLTFRELAYPRRAYFERTEPAVTAPELPRGDLWAQVSGLLEGGPLGEAERRFPIGEASSEGVLEFRGEPVLVKTRRGDRRWTLDEFARRSPHYFRELGLRCAAVGRASGLLVIAYESAATWTDRLAAIRVRFDPVDSWRAYADRQRASLALALRDRDPASATACPGWMFDSCPYRSVCGCAGARSPGNQR
ncbi:MAG TPA: hypothetical protein VLY85_03725 [Thermoplasmata archaeon]|nr:hypothetical protein [Thermoplasmata archaeon]